MLVFFGGFGELRRAEVVREFPGSNFVMVRFLDAAGNAHGRANLWIVLKNWVFPVDATLPITGTMLSQPIAVGQRVAHYIPRLNPHACYGGNLQFEVEVGVVTAVGDDCNTIQLERTGKEHTYPNTCTRVELTLELSAIADFLRERNEQRLEAERQEKLRRDLEEARRAVVTPSPRPSAPVRWWRQLRAAVSSK